MKLLKDILYKAGLIEVVGSTNITISAISFDSRKIEKDSLFVAVKGTLSDGHKYIDETISKGAIAILCEVFPKQINEKVTYIKVKDTTVALGIIASNYFDNPSEQLKLVGVTGTNGKTTTVTTRDFVISAQGHYGYIMSHRNNMSHLIKGHIYGAELNYIFRTDGTKPWQQTHNYPEVGVCLLHMYLANPE